MLGTDEFRPLAEIQSRAHGLAGLPVVTVAHPIGGIPEAAVAAKAGAVVDEVVIALTHDRAVTGRAEARPRGRAARGAGRSRRVPGIRHGHGAGATGCP